MQYIQYSAKIKIFQNCIFMLTMERYMYMYFLLDYSKQGDPTPSTTVLSAVFMEYYRMYALYISLIWIYECKFQLSISVNT